MKVDDQPYGSINRPDSIVTKEEEVNKKIGKTIARKRKIAELTQEEVAEALGIGNEAFSRIERGLVSPGIYKLYQLADIFGCSVESFLIEGSKRPKDQAEYINQMLTKNSVGDRALIVEIVERLSRHFSKKATEVS